MWLPVVTFAAVASACAYLYAKYLFSYWTRLGVKCLAPSLPFGNFGKNFMQKLTIGELTQEFYNATTEPFIGVYATFRPILILNDLELIRQVLIKDFQHFVDRGVFHDEAIDPLSVHLFAIDGAKWKNLRVKLSPTFTSGKLKAMFSTLVDCSKQLQNHLENASTNGESVEIREFVARYTTNVIASVAFGIEIDCFKNPDTSFRKYGRKIFELSVKNGLRFMMMFLTPKLMKLLKVRVFDRDVCDFMTSVMKQTLEMREKQNIVRKDFFQLLVQLRNTGNVQLDDQWETLITNDEYSKKMSIEEMTAQAFIFYLAGFETSSSTGSFCLYEIAKNPDIQRIVQNEIDTVLEQYGGQITYESVNDMKYLEACIDETLRKYPVVPILNRECTKEYKIPGTNVTLEKGTAVQIPIFALHRDPKYYPEPEKFDPTRFLVENSNSKSFVEMPQLAFGDGPRNCIGMRLGKMQTKVGIISMLQKYNFALGEQHIGRELKFSPAHFALSTTTGINLKVTLR